MKIRYKVTDIHDDHAHEGSDSVGGEAVIRGIRRGEIDMLTGDVRRHADVEARARRRFAE